MLTSREVRALRAWLRERGDAPGPLFPSRKGAGISQQMLDVLMKRYGAAAELPPELCHTHTLKHSCATHLLNRGLQIEDVQDHRTSQHPVDSRIREVLEPAPGREGRPPARLVITAS